MSACALCGGPAANRFCSRAHYWAWMRSPDAKPRLREAAHRTALSRRLADERRRARSAALQDGAGAEYLVSALVWAEASRIPRLMAELEEVARRHGLAFRLLGPFQRG